MNIGLIGYGCVSSGFDKILQSQLLINHTITKVAIRDKHKHQDCLYPLTENAMEIVTDPDIDIVVEAIDDATAALKFGRQALKNGKHLITANKKMMAEHFEELQKLASNNSVSLRFEAAVAGSIPVIQLLNSYFAHDPIIEIQGVLNGSSNYILSKMESERLEFDEALKQAQILGFAESDPYLDISGMDAVNKLSLIATLISGDWISPHSIPAVGIDTLRPEWIRQSEDAGLRIRQVASLSFTQFGAASWVLPTLVDQNNPLYHVNNEFNGVVIQSEYAGKQFFSGKGAGSLPTGTALYADLQQINHHSDRTCGIVQQNESRDKFLVVYKEDVEIFRELTINKTALHGFLKRYGHEIESVIYSPGQTGTSFQNQHKAKMKRSA